MPSSILTRKKLQCYLQDVGTFSNPKLQLEQYPTSAQVATDILFNMQTVDGALQGMSVADLGCGPGVFSIGACLLGASYVLAVDVDADALNDLSENLDAHDLKHDCIDVMLADVTRLSRDDGRKLVDTVILNPPFGTHASNTGIDMKFLNAALSMAQSHVYSLHKSTTRSHVLKTVEATGANSKVVAELRFDIPRMYKRHKQNTVDIQVDLVHAWF
ncbi:hypothetical protein CRM22_000869 [Opisthorchis felineus]|uniref:Methyltransferase small domain-containing protein n=1 Tax=Opisthorchis felineus TaxID=147828 RepID=A0A4S2MD48_OPIFE|nr:hypothetical protein CRM22_000869 [Opisthorchis felineus]